MINSRTEQHDITRLGVREQSRVAALEKPDFPKTSG